MSAVTLFALLSFLQTPYTGELVLNGQRESPWCHLFHSRSRVFKANFKISEKREEQIKDEHIWRLIMLGGRWNVSHIYVPVCVMLMEIRDM